MTFEAVARLESMTKAAVELRVTREAVSRQIRTLEQFIGSKLFERDARTINLTPAGKEFAATISPALETIAAATETLQNSKVQTRLTIAASVAISNHWLAPRLAAFCADHPRIDIRIVASDSHKDLRDHDANIGIWYGDGNWPTVDAVKLSGSVTFPVGEPDYLREHGPITKPEDLLDHTILHLEGAQHSIEDWEWWLSQAKVVNRKPRRRIVFNSYVDVLQAAMSGQGLALGYSPTIDFLLAKGTLIKALDMEFSKGFSIYQVTPRNLPATMAAKQFSAWLKAQNEA